MTFSEWQFGRIRARLVAYYLNEKFRLKAQKTYRKEKQKQWHEATLYWRKEKKREYLEPFDYRGSENYSWLEVAEEIMLSKANDLRMPDSYEPFVEDKTNYDSGWDITDNILQKMHVGDIKYPKGRPKYRRYPVPSDRKIKAIKQFLIFEGYLSETDLIEPSKLPEMPPCMVGLSKATACFPIEARKAYDGDFRALNASGTLVRGKPPLTFHERRRCIPSCSKHQACLQH